MTPTLDQQWLLGHCINTQNGCFSTETLTQAADVDKMLDEFFAKPPKSGMVIHFHGGLVSRDTGLETAGRLGPLYEKAGAYPVFFIWEADALSAIGNNLADIAQDPVFHELVRKALEFALGMVTGAVGTRGLSAGQVDSLEVSDKVDDWFSGKTKKVPYDGLSLAPAPFTSRGPKVDWTTTDIRANLESDMRFQSVIGNADASSAMDARLQSSLAQGTGQRGLIQLAKIALVLERIVKAVVVRCLTHRDHGLFTTVLEETYRAAYLDKVGQAFLWNQMKKDTADAFGQAVDPSFPPGGTYLLSALAKCMKTSGLTPRITLVGHSTGGNYICNFLEAADKVLPKGLTFDIVLLAPAVKIPTFMTTLGDCGRRIANIRLFGMQDSVESADVMALGVIRPQQLARMVYPRSLLYFVSGLLETTEVDAPLLGMQRFFNATGVFGTSVHPEVAEARKYFANHSSWSLADPAPAGWRTTSRSHGGFDNDPATLESLATITRSGF